MKVVGSILTTLLLAGCGSGTPGIDTVRGDLDNPTGSINEKSAVAAAAQRQSNSGPASSIGGTNPFGAGGLTAAGKSASRLDALLPLRPFFQHVERATGTRVSIHGLRAEQFEANGFFDCFANALAQVSGGVSGDSFDASYEIDFDQCPDSGLSGRLVVDISGKVDQATGSFDMEASYEYDQLCVLGDVVLCQTGRMDLEGDGSISTTGGDIALNTIAAWDIKTTLREAGNERKFVNKGGLEMKIDSTNTMTNGSFRMVVYLTDSKGQEVSYTLTLKFNDAGSSFTIRGKDGTLTCTLSGSSGSCTGDGSLEWTAEDWAAAFDVYGGF